MERPVLHGSVVVTVLGQSKSVQWKNDQGTGRRAPDRQ